MIGLTVRAGGAAPKGGAAPLILNVPDRPLFTAGYFRLGSKAELPLASPQRLNGGIQHAK